MKVTPSKDNYLLSEDCLLPGSAEEKRKRSRKQTRQLEREMERRERERNMELVNNFLSGKASMVWLFVLGENTPEAELEQVREVYS